MPGSLPVGADLSDVVLVVDAINGRNIRRADLAAARDTLERARALGARAVTVATTNSPQHVPHDTALEQWDDERLNADLHSWLAFADQKLAPPPSAFTHSGNGRGSPPPAAVGEEEPTASALSQCLA